ncbi:MAG: hypothetical protein IT269_10810 [Saprospiraceae bacterium]|nr:hypothetical protein [Saprospiraceae bacterium]
MTLPQIATLAMINQEFLEKLEYSISKALSNSSDKALKSIWCDGILMPDLEGNLVQKTIHDTRAVEVTALMGRDGQDSYKMILRFGDKSVSRNARNLDLLTCIPNTDSDDWIIIDEHRKEVEIILD